MPRPRLASSTGAATASTRPGKSASRRSTASRHAARRSATGSVAETGGSRARGIGSTSAEVITPGPGSCAPAARRSRITSTMSTTWRVSTTSCTRKIRAPCMRRDRGGGEGPGEAFADGQVERLPHEVLVGQRDQHRPAGRRPSRRAAGSGRGSRCVVLPKSWAGSITMLSRSTPAASARSAYAVVSAIALATTSAYSIRCGRVRGVDAAGVGADDRRRRTPPPRRPAPGRRRPRRR